MWNPWIWGTASAAAATVAAVAARQAWRRVQARGLDRWAPAALFRTAAPVDLDAGPVHVFLAVCDHYEPEWGEPDRQTALGRVAEWRREYPRRLGAFRDVDGRPPRHTFFFPQDQYQPAYLDVLAELVAAGYGDVDVHLHHHDDTEAGLREKLAGFRDALFHRHGLLRRDPQTGRIVYGFIHGNWALCNSRRDGRWCGVDHELPILLDTGCYADFTFPSAPSDTQPRTINSLYYAQDIPGRRAAHEFGGRATLGREPAADSLLMVQGPLLFDWGRRKWGLLPRVENGDLLGNHPPSRARLELWLRAGVHVAGRPDWRFIKLHTHGCKPANQAMLLGEPFARFHADLAALHAQQPNFRYHYVSAWELAQLIHAAERGVRDPAAVLDAAAAPTAAATCC